MAMAAIAIAKGESMSPIPIDSAIGYFLSRALLLRRVAYANCQNVTRCAMQDPVGGGAQEQGKTMTTMTAHHYQVSMMGLGSPLDLMLRPPEDQMSACFGYTNAVGKLGEMRASLFVDLILNRREVHRHISAVRQAEWFDDVNDVKFCLGCLHDGQCPISDGPGFLGQVDCEHDAVIRVHVVSRSHLRAP